ncbi:MAG TPA: sulfatase [Tepidisphaeraceae bacterium]|nr:sulfatase [Tepidisphaeraceae bacterium]
MSFIKQSALRIVFASIASIAVASLAHAADRPNILFIMTDDHAYQAIGAYGSNRNETPNIDRMAAEGIRFDRCYVTNSICSPSRATILTGRYSHKNGVPDNRTDFDGSQTTFPKLFRSGGYQTAVIGKWHLHTEPTGFDHWEVLPGQGKYYTPDFITPAGQAPVPGYVTDIITDKAVHWLKSQRDNSKPFLLMVQHKAPHRPWDPAPEKLKKMAGRNFPEPPTLLEDYSRRGKAAQFAELRISQMNDRDVKLWEPDNHHRVWLFNHMVEEQKKAWETLVDPRRAAFIAANPAGDDRTRWYYQLYMKDYLACVDSVDDGIGQLLSTLDELKLADNTIVIYTSDQGFYLGEHGWFDKRMMYEESFRTPLVIRWPGVVVPGRVERAMVGNVDFAQTFLAAAGLKAPPEMQGMSILPILKGETPENWRSSFYYHYYEGEEKEHKVYRHEGVTNGRAKLIHFYPIDEWEMFDLEKDPQEMNNVYGLTEYAAVQRELEAELARLKKELEVPEQ